MKQRGLKALRDVLKMERSYVTDDLPYCGVQTMQTLNRPARALILNHPKTTFPVNKLQAD